MSKMHTAYYSKAIDANDLKDNGGTVLMGGNIASTGAITNAPDKTITGAGAMAKAGPVNSANVGTTKANDSGTFAVLTPGHYVAKGGNVTSQLAGVAYRGLRGGGKVTQTESIHTGLTRKTVLITSWDYATGAATLSESNPSADDFDINSAYVEPTRALPGNVVILDDGISPTATALSAKTDG